MKKLILFLIIVLTLSCTSQSGKKEHLLVIQTELQRFNAIPSPLILKDYTFENGVTEQVVIMQHNDSIIIFRGRNPLTEYLLKTYNRNDTIK